MILDAALDVFGERGFAEARLEDVAARARVAEDTIYLYFASKEALFEAIIRTGVGAPIAALSAELASQELPFDAILRAIFARLRTEILATRRKEIIRLVLAEAGRFPQLAEFYHREVVSRGMVLLRGIAERALARGEIASDEIVELPQLVIAPALVAFLWATLFERFEELDFGGAVQRPCGTDHPRSEDKAMRSARIVVVLVLLVVAGAGAYWWMTADEVGEEIQGYRRQPGLHGAGRGWTDRQDAGRGGGRRKGGAAPVRAGIRNADWAAERGGGPIAPG